MDNLPRSVDGGIERLIEEGYLLYRRGAYLVAAIPYLDSEGRPQRGLLVDTLNLDPDGRVRTAPTNHQMYFIGQQPHDSQGRILFGGAGSNNTPLFDGLTSSFFWSWKQLDSAGAKRDYQSLYEKVTEYATYISGPAEAKFPNFTVTPFASSLEEERPCPFPFEDMNSARANLLELDRVLEDESILVIGAGGTGSYIFDLLSKARVKNISIYDYDYLDLHNAFRIPGATKREEIGQPKVEVLAQRYEGWHSGTTFISEKLGENSGPLFRGKTFAFLAIDKISPRRTIAKMLREMGIPFIVVGMGLHHGDPGLTGIVDTTLIDGATPQEIFDEVAGDHLEDIPDEYQQNIQTVELNALNASMAVFMYKRYRGYYASNRKVHQAMFTLSSMQLDLECET